MKKLLSTILVLAFVLAALSALTPSISAKSGTISESEAKELIVKAYEFCRNVRGGFAHIHENSSEYKIEVKYGEDYRDWENYWLVIEENLPGVRGNKTHDQCANMRKPYIPKTPHRRLMLTS